MKKEDVFSGVCIFILAVVLAYVVAICVVSCKKGHDIMRHCEQIEAEQEERAIASGAYAKENIDEYIFWFEERTDVESEAKRYVEGGHSGRKELKKRLMERYERELDELFETLDKMN